MNMKVRKVYYEQQKVNSLCLIYFELYFAIIKGDIKQILPSEKTLIHVYKCVKNYIFAQA
jgi:hypothetical protein